MSPYPADLYPIPPGPPQSAKELVDQLIDERAPRLRKHPWLWNVVRPTAGALMGYRDAIAMVETVRPMRAREAFDWAVDYLDLTVNTHGLDAIPDTGPVVIIGNHPGGIADGIALWQAIREKRPDLCFLANRDALRVCPGLEDMLIPVEWRKNARSRANARDTLRGSMEALNHGRCLAIFPSGRMARWRWKRWGLVEEPWAPTAISLARRFNTPVVTLGVRQSMPIAFYALDQIHEELRDITLFHGLMRQRGKTYRMRFSDPVPAREIPGSEAEATAAILKQAEALAWGR